MGCLQTVFALSTKLPGQMEACHTHLGEVRQTVYAHGALPAPYAYGSYQLVNVPILTLCSLAFQVVRHVPSPVPDKWQSSQPSRFDWLPHRSRSLPRACGGS